ncbi:MAG: hypothetical protein HY747_09520, partial [Elusimicrobia bacterium]|nr:hypothetical protein [Elusimicrobiota bacterium]
MPKIKHKIKQTILSRFLSLFLSFLLILELIPPQALAAVKGDEEAKAVEISSQELNTSEENQAQALLQNIFEGAVVRSSSLGKGQSPVGTVPKDEDLTPVP